jgi:hypothetical protein
MHDMHQDAKAGKSMFLHVKQRMQAMRSKRADLGDKR